MSRFRIYGFLLMAVAAIGLLPSDAQAFLRARISTDGGTTFSVFDAPGGENGLSVSGVVVFNGVEISVSGTSNQPGNSPIGQITQTNISINGNTTGSEVINLVVDVSDIGFVQPTGLSVLSSTLSGTYGPNVTNGAGTTTFSSHLSLANTQFAYGALTGGDQAFTIPLIGSGTANIVGAGTLDTIIDITSTPFAMTNHFVLGTLTIGAGAQITLGGTTTVMTVVPEPATIVGALVGMPIAGLLWRRRQKNANSALAV